MSVEPNTGKTPPQDIDLEAVVLGSMLLSGESLIEVIDILKVDTFFTPDHQQIFTCIVSLFKQGITPDLLVVYNESQKLGFKISLVYLSKLTNRVASAAGLEYKARILAQFAIRRKLIEECTELTKLSYDPMHDVFDLVQSHDDNISNTIQYYAKSAIQTVEQLAIEALKDLQQKNDIKSGVSGIGTGFMDLDRITAGWQNSDLIVIAARPAMGKTAFLITMAMTAAIRFNVPVAIFSLEMSSLSLMKRMISAQCSVNSELIQSRTLTDGDFQLIHSRIQPLLNAPLFIDDTSDMSILELRTKAMRLHKQNGIKMIVIDYLQLINGTGGNREQEISSISRGLKQLAKQLNIPVIALSQLSRSVESRSDKRPMLSDLRESGAIEQDADIVSFLYRPEYYGLMTDENGESLVGIAEVIVAKHRSGGTGTARLKFIGQYTKFENQNEYYQNDPIKPNTNFDNVNDVPF